MAIAIDRNVDLIRWQKLLGEAMSRFELFKSWRGRPATLPPITDKIVLSEVVDEGPIRAPLESDPQPISAFLCIIDYEGENRLLTCRRYEGIGDHRYVGAICHQAKGYRQFRCDRISAVFDAQTGELLGDGNYFSQFALDSWRGKAETWGLKPSQKGQLVAGLNVLAFMARCDGEWHNFETEVIEQFVSLMWRRMAWVGEPDMSGILAHAQRLAPDADTFFRSMKYYAGSEKARTLLLGTIAALVAADGEISSPETNWAIEADAFFTELDDKLYSTFIDA